MALVLGHQTLPETWSETRIGDIRHGLFGPPELAASLGEGPVPVARVLELPFVMPVTSMDGRAVVGDDGCPVSSDRRKSGHQVQTIALALEVASRSGQVAYGPVIAATDYIDRGRLREIVVEGWDVREALYVICNANRVRSRQNAAITLALRDALKELDARFEDRASMRLPQALPEP
jgi:DNA-binding transcriptional LysR family regulator